MTNVKKCSTCGRTYLDLSLNFCLDDGTSLLASERLDEEITLVRTDQLAEVQRATGEKVLSLKVSSLNKEEKGIVSSPNSNYWFRVTCLDRNGEPVPSKVTITSSFEVELSLGDESLLTAAANSHLITVPVEGLNLLVVNRSISDNQIAFVLNNSLAEPILKVLHWDLPPGT